MLLRLIYALQSGFNECVVFGEATVSIDWIVYARLQYCHCLFRIDRLSLGVLKGNYSLYIVPHVVFDFMFQGVSAHSLGSVYSDGGHVKYSLIFLGYVSNEFFVAVYLILLSLFKNGIEFGFVRF